MVAAKHTITKRSALVRLETQGDAGFSPVLRSRCRRIDPIAPIPRR